MTEPRARKTGATAITPAELAAWIHAVPVGVCVTLPNGVIIDKRLSFPTYYHGYSPPTPSGYTCVSCGTWVGNGLAHSCGGRLS